MTDNKEYLPQYTLNQLSDRVAMKLSYINRLYKADKVWDNIIGLCKRIEAEPRDVSTVIIEMTNITETPIKGCDLKWSHVKLTLVYILLYYRHKDEAVYRRKVFSQLVKNMEIFVDDKYLKVRIQQEIENIIEEDKLLESEMPLQGIQPEPSLQDIANGRKKFIQAINNGNVDVETISWADATIGFDRDVMKELFWGIVDDDVLKTITAAIINTWNKLVNKSDPFSMMASLSPWKFGGATKESINKFFEDLWVERNAKNLYSSVVIGKIDNVRKKVIQPNVSKIHNATSADVKQLESLKERITKLEKENTELKNINKSQKARLAESEKSATLAVEIEEILIELLTPIFNKDSDIARTFINEVRDCDDIEIVKITGRYVKETKVSTSFIYRPLWRLLHAFRIYNSGERNWNTTLKSRINIKKS